MPSADRYLISLYQGLYSIESIVKMFWSQMCRLYVLLSGWWGGGGVVGLAGAALLWLVSAIVLQSRTKDKLRFWGELLQSTSILGQFISRTREIILLLQR